ncbi:MAG TPA: YlxR family protein [Candidatus Onthocola stercorigallinarum]|nr:YlxR family protein [Candidatus Onthocola stercorigallinarum]
MAMNKKIPMRSCVVTKESLPKKELIRVVRDKEGNVTIDLTGKQNGRGAYLKKDLDVIKKAKKSKILERALGVSIPDNIYEELERMIK